MISAKAEIANHFPVKYPQCFLLSPLLWVVWGEACEVDMYPQSRAVSSRNPSAQLGGLSRLPLKSQPPTLMFPEP